jgi:hypothetical protein
MNDRMRDRRRDAGKAVPMLGLTLLLLPIGLAGPASAAPGACASSSFGSWISVAPFPLERASAGHYTLTPSDYRRLRKMGFSDREVYIAGNTADWSGKSLELVVQMLFRGETSDSIARWLMVDRKVIETPRPEWTTDAWRKAGR